MRKIPEYIWQKAEQNQIRREKTRLRKNGTISDRSVPLVLEKVNGLWKLPSLKIAQP